MTAGDGSCRKALFTKAGKTGQVCSSHTLFIKSNLAGAWQATRTWMQRGTGQFIVAAQPVYHHMWPYKISQEVREGMENPRQYQIERIRPLSGPETSLALALCGLIHLDCSQVGSIFHCMPGVWEEQGPGQLWHGSAAGAALGGVAKKRLLPSRTYRKDNDWPDAPIVPCHDTDLAITIQRCVMQGWGPHGAYVDGAITSYQLQIPLDRAVLDRHIG